MRYSLAQVGEATGGDLLGDPAAMLDGAATDSRRVRRGQLFVPLRAERDGHDFIEAAVSAGAGAYLTEGPLPVAVPAVRVGDTLSALSRLAVAARQRLHVPLIAVTGSSGKTSVKDLCLGALGSAAWGSEASFNNEIGVPLTLVEAPETASVVVCELGSRGLGHVSHLCGIAQPSIGIITTIGPAHIEMLGSIDNVARAKAELVAALPPSGLAVLPADDRWLPVLRAEATAPVVLFGTAHGADVRAEAVVLDEMMRGSFTLRSPWGSARVHLALSGDHQVRNALAAAAAALVTGRPVECVAQGLAKAEVSPWRMQVQETPDGVLLLNDAYNSNPQSLRAALAVLGGFAEKGRRPVAVLGEMAELGAVSEEEHHRAGLEVAAIGDLAALIVVRSGAVGSPDAVSALVAGATEGGITALVVEGTEEARERLETILRPGDVVLVKGSRIVGLERLATALVSGSSS
jgi:UDP-N-acetylmuramoyl-tripeptide--D-alanyl-D-alanine ligase